MTFDEAWEAAGFAPGEAVGSAQEREEAWEAIRGNLDEELIRWFLNGGQL
jgi:hypothetical protein